MRNDRILISTVLGAKIRYYRTLCGKTQKELAALTNFSVSTIQRIEEGQYDNIAPLATLIDIANALNLDVAAFLTISDEEKRLALSKRKNRGRKYL